MKEKQILKWFYKRLKRKSKIPYSRFGDTFEEALQYFEKKYNIEIKSLTTIEEEIYNKIVEEFPDFPSFGCFDISYGKGWIHKHCPRKTCKGCNIFPSMEKRGKTDIAEGVTFEIPVGETSKEEAEQNIKDLMQSYKEKVEWNEDTGEVKIKGDIKLPYNKEYWL